MKASIVPCEVASKQANGGMIWPPGKTSIRNRPPLISSTSFPTRWAALWTPSAGVQLVDMRHWILGWAMAYGARTVAAAPAATIPAAVARNCRRAVMAAGPLGLAASGHSTRPAATTARARASL